MTRSQHVAHVVAIVFLALGAGLVEFLTSSPAAHAAWAPAALIVVKYLVAALGAKAVPPIVALMLLVKVASCVHFPPGVNVPACGLDVVDDVATALVCTLADHTPLPACVLDGLRKIAADHNCDVTGIVATIAGSARKNADMTGDELEATKGKRAQAWLNAQPPNPADVPPLHDKKAK